MNEAFLIIGQIEIICLPVRPDGSGGDNYSPDPA